MPKSSGQKLKLLYLMQILMTRSDQDHPLSVQELITALEEQDISAERKSIYADMEALEEYGLDIIKVRGKNNKYYVGERIFQLAELKLLVDVVQASNFITEKKSADLIGKLGSLASEHEARLMQRQVYVTGRPKTINEEIYYNVDKIHSAISSGKKIKFHYYEWVVDSAYPRLFDRRLRHGGEDYTASPWALTWDDENYYLIAYDSARGDIRHYRVDKMSDIRVTQDKRDGQEQFHQFDIASYNKMTFGMFSGEETKVTLKFSNYLIGVVVDRFGRDITIHRAGEGHFLIHLKIVVSPQFISWLFGFGNDVEVISPNRVRQYLRDELDKVKAVYDK